MATITQLEYILSVDKYRHFGKASKASHITQPTLSQQIQKLEDELGIMLFDRLQKPIIPTPEGQRFIEQAKIVLREHQKLLHFAKKQTHEIAGEFKLGIIPTVATYLLPLFLKEYSKKYPKVDLFIEELTTDAIIDGLNQDHLDGAILATPLEKSAFKEHPLYYEHFYLYLSKGHPLLKKHNLTSEDLNGNQMWLLKDGHCFKSQVANFCTLDKTHDSVMNNVHFQSGSLEVLRSLVRDSEGYTVIPALMVSKMPAGEIKEHVRPFRAPIPTREISFIYRRDHWKLDIIRSIEENIVEHLPDEIKTTHTKKEKVLPL